MRLSDRIWTIITLAMLAYLGFYVFGLVMGVYGASDVLYLTIPAVVFAVVVGFQLVSRRREGTTPTEDAINRNSRHLRESRGF